MEKISVLKSTPFISQDYSFKDSNLITKRTFEKVFGSPGDRIEVHLYNSAQDLIASDYNYKQYQLGDSSQDGLYNDIFVDPERYVQDQGYNYGEFKINYYFYTDILGSNSTTRFFISDISQDRTELKITSLGIDYETLSRKYLDYITNRAQKSYYSDFVLNFGDNNVFIGVNMLVKTDNPNESSLFIKLYEPLPGNFGIKDTLWLAEELSEPYSFNYSSKFISEEEETAETVNYLRGPNTNIELNQIGGLTTPYFNISNLLDTTVSSSYQQLTSFLSESAVEVNIDFSDFNNFIHFSSARQRLENFKYKLGLIQGFTRDLGSLNALNPLASDTYISSSKAVLKDKIDTIIDKFDEYDYYLYYSSESTAWPKVEDAGTYAWVGYSNAPYGSSPTSASLYQPYVNAPVDSIIAQEWYGSLDYSNQYYGGMINSASVYDNLNRNYVWNTLPDYIQEDPQNDKLELFCGLLGQHYDTLWTYQKAITDLRDADNRPNFGISKDLVAETLRNFGIKLYTNSRSSADIYSAFFGITPSGSLLPSTGSLRIETYVTESVQTIPQDTITKEIYKRIYHNLPFLLKSRGTKTGLRALLNCFGIPDTVIKIREFGGYNKKDTDLIKQFGSRFSYAFNTAFSGSMLYDSDAEYDTSGSYYNSPFGTVNLHWQPIVPVEEPRYDQEGAVFDDNNSQSLYDGGATDIVPDTIEFRFQTPGTPYDDQYSQSLFQVNYPLSGSPLTQAVNFGVQLFYSSASNSNYGSDTLNKQHEKYGEMRLFMSGAQGYIKSSPMYLPFFDGGWWNVMLQRETGGLRLSNTGSDNRYWLYAKNSIYDGNSGKVLGYQGSSSVFISGSTSESYNASWNNFTQWDLEEFYGYDGIIDIWDGADSLYDNYQRPPMYAYLGGSGLGDVLAPKYITFSGSFQEFRYWKVVLSESKFDIHTLNPMSLVGNDEPKPLPTRTPSATPTNSPTRTPSVTPSITPSNTPSISQSPTVTRSITVSKSITPSITPTISITSAPGASPTPTISVSTSRPISATPTRSRTMSRTRTVSRTGTPSKSPTPTRTRTISITPTITPTKTPFPTPSTGGICTNLQGNWFIAGNGQLSLEDLCNNGPWSGFGVQSPSPTMLAYNLVYCRNGSPFTWQNYVGYWIISNSPIINFDPSGQQSFTYVKIDSTTATVNAQGGAYVIEAGFYTCGDPGGGGGA